LVIVTRGVGDPDLESSALVYSVTVSLLPLSTHRLSEEPKAIAAPSGLAEIITDGAGETFASSLLLYSTTVLSPTLDTQRSPEASNASPLGPSTPLVITASGRASVELGRYKVIEPGPTPPPPAAPGFVTKIVPAAGPATLGATEEASDAAGELAKPVPDTIAATRVAPATVRDATRAQRTVRGRGERGGEAIVDIVISLMFGDKATICSSGLRPNLSKVLR
jgi:hypothetical protein